ncbi:MAG TPA: DUF3108 domain-containing protein [Pyrinomonadaceae bacterium]|nr:DUF3108 domain-containing protein [Pyrinomonadaceae bacterium]
MANAQRVKPPFVEGETLTYEGKFNKLLASISVAELTFTVDRIDGDDFLIKAEARSKSTLLKIFRYTFLQTIESTIDADRFRAIKTVKHDVQKDRVRDSEALFDYKDKRVTYTEVDPKEPNKAPRRIASAIEGTTHDLISGIYSLRMLPLAIGKTFQLQISDSGLVYDIPVKVTARERIKSEIGRFWCFRVEPLIFGPGRLIEKDGKMIIWITDDARRIPVRSQVSAPIGKIEIKIRSASNAKMAGI